MNDTDNDDNSSVELEYVKDSNEELKEGSQTNNGIYHGRTRRFD